MLEDHKVVKTVKNRYKKRIKYITSLVHALEYSILESQQSDREILMALRLDNLKNYNTETQIQEIEKENTQLLDMLQLKHDESNTSRSTPSSSCSTMSLVHLQYKYEELLANQNGLLKILDLRLSDVRKYKEENVKLKEVIEKLKVDLENYKDQVSKLSERNKELRFRKNNKILRLKNDRNTLAIIHNRMVNLLNRQCMEDDDILHNEIRETTQSDRALLLQEIRKNNILSYENFQLQQENEYLQSVLNVKKRLCSETTSIT